MATATTPTPPSTPGPTRAATASIATATASPPPPPAARPPVPPPPAPPSSPPPAAPPPTAPTGSRCPRAASPGFGATRPRTGAAGPSASSATPPPRPASPTSAGAEHDLAGLAVSPAAASASSLPALASLDLNALDWEELRVDAAHAGLVTYQSRPIPRSALRIPFGQDGYTLYGGETGYYWCGGAASYTDAGIGAVNNPPGAPADCKGHGFLGSGWDFSESDAPNTGLTLCGGDGSYWLTAGWAASVVYYGGAGGAQAIWVR